MMGTRRKARSTESASGAEVGCPAPCRLCGARARACGGCPGFQVWFRAVDANDPGVMLHCALCGCPAHQHSIDQVCPTRAGASCIREGPREILYADAPL